VRQERIPSPAARLAIAGFALTISLLVPCAAFAATTTSTPVPTPTPAPNGWYWPMNHVHTAPAPGWLSFRTWYSLSPKAWHLAWDDVLTVGRPVYSLGYGRVVISRMDVSGYGPGGGRGGAMVVRYRDSASTYFDALLGHVVIDIKKFPVGTLVRPGQPIAKLNAYDPPHLHFGIRKGASFPKPLPSTPHKFENTVGMLMGHTFEYSKNASGTLVPQTYGFVDPAAWLIARSPWVRVAAAPAAPSTPKRVSRGTTFKTSGSFNATRVIEAVPVTLIGERLEGGHWVRRAHWHGSIGRVNGAAAHYDAAIRVSSSGTWRLRLQVPETMDWTAADSASSKRFTVR
jgi:hypothetical protein